MNADGRVSEARFGCLSLRIGDFGSLRVEDDVLVFKNTGWRGVEDDESIKAIQTRRDKTNVPVRNPDDWLETPKVPQLNRQIFYIVNCKFGLR